MDSTSTLRTVVTSAYDSAGIHKVKTDTIIKQTTESILVKKDSYIDWITPVTKLISDFTWPIVIIITFILFKEQIANLIERIKDLSVGKEGFHIVASERKTPADNSVMESDFLADETKLKLLLSDNSVKRVLTTFWLKQKTIQDRNYRYSFILNSTNKEYTEFVSAIIKLKEANLVSQDPVSMQYYLTERGFDFCKDNEKDLTSEVFKI